MTLNITVTATATVAAALVVEMKALHRIVALHNELSKQEIKQALETPYKLVQNTLMAHYGTIQKNWKDMHQAQAKLLHAMRS